MVGQDQRGMWSGVVEQGPRTWLNRHTPDRGKKEGEVKREHADKNRAVWGMKNEERSGIADSWLSRCCLSGCLVLVLVLVR